MLRRACGFFLDAAGGIVGVTNLLRDRKRAVRLGILLLILCVCGIGALLLAPRMDLPCIAQQVVHADDDYYAGWTCLHYAAIRGDVDTIEQMLEAGMPIDQTDQLGRTALMEAASAGALTAVDELIVHGANVNAADRAGFTALQLAAQSQHAAVVRRLLRADAQVNTTNRWQQTALWLVSWQTRQSNTQVAHSLVAAGAEVNLADEHGNTPMHMAARAGRNRMVAYLLQAGAQVDPRNQRGQTPLYLAVIGNHLRSARLLLRHGADPNISADKRSALEMALQNGYRDIADLLAAYGARGYRRFASRARIERGRQRLQAGQAKAAITAFNAALAVAPNNASAHYYRALAYLQTGQPRQAIQDLQRALTLAPEHVEALEQAGLVYTQLEQYQRAAETLQKLIALQPEYGRAYHLLAVAQRQLEQPSKAQANSTKACELGYQSAC